MDSPSLEEVLREVLNREGWVTGKVNPDAIEALRRELLGDAQPSDALRDYVVSVSGSPKLQIDYVLN